jgi:hypothetical protein
LIIKATSCVFHTATSILFAKLRNQQNHKTLIFMILQSNKSFSPLCSNVLSAVAEVGVALVLIYSSFFIGGLVLSLIVLSTLLIAHLIAKFVGTALAICLGVLFTLFVIILEFLVLIPLLKEIPPTRSLFFTQKVIEPFTARGSLFENLIELNLAGAFLISLVPIILVLVTTVRIKKIDLRNGFNPVVALICFLPLTWGAYKKGHDLLSYVVSTTSGDGRNFFLHVQRIRVTSEFTNFSNIRSQGDFSASLASLVSDGMGSTGILEFNDQYGVAALYVLFAVLIASSAIAIVTSLAARDTETRLVDGSPVAWTLYIIVAIASIQMPWVMNEIFRSGFFSTFVVMAFCGVAVAIVFAKIAPVYMSLILLKLSILIFATYPIAAIYPLLGILFIGLLYLKIRINHGDALPVIISVIFIVGIVYMVPTFLNQLRSRLQLEGAIAYMQDDFWLPIAIAGLAIAFLSGPVRLIGLVIATVGACTAGFQWLAGELRKENGLDGYGYYGAKFAYIGLFILLITLFSTAGSFIYSYASRLNNELDTKSRLGHLRQVVGASGMLIFAAVANGHVLPESRGFYGNDSNWTQPSTQGLELALQYWNQPAVLFLKVSDPGNDVLTNFWHPFYWDNEPWRWIYGGNGDSVEAVCLFIENKEVVIITRDPAYGNALREECQAVVTVI